MASKCLNCDSTKTNAFDYCQSCWPAAKDRILSEVKAVSDQARHERQQAELDALPKFSPEWATLKMRMLIPAEGGYDEEIIHRSADRLLCEILTHLGYGEAVRIFEDADKWYA